MKTELTIYPEIKYIINNYPEDNYKRIFEYFLYMQENGIKIYRDTFEVLR